MASTEKDSRFIRTEMLIGEEGLSALSSSRVIVFGAGGVGGAAIEALARGGVGTIDIVDNDLVAMSNINRQIIAVESTIGLKKTSAAKMRILEINPRILAEEIDMFVLPENICEIDFSKYNYVIDAIDTVSGKLAIIEQAKLAGVKVISSMGTGNKLNPFMFEIADISKTSVCPLARVMRRELKSRGIKGVKVLYSKEESVIPRVSGDSETKGAAKRAAPGSISFVPPVAGMLIASEVIKDLIKV